MTSEEITLALKQYLPIPDDVRELMKATWGDTPWKWPFIAVSINKDKNHKNLTTLCPTNHNGLSIWEKHKENIKEDPESHRVLFVPELIPDALARWVVIEPAHEMTKNLIFSTFKVVLPPKSKTLKDIIEYIDERKVAIIDMFAKSGGVRPRRTLRGPPPQTTGTGMRVDIDICETESGYCNYTASRQTNSCELTSDMLNEIRDIATENQDPEAARDRLQEIIRDSLGEEDHDTGNYDYDSFDAQDVEFEQDDTNYDAILEEILEG